MDLGKLMHQDTAKRKTRKGRFLIALVFLCFFPCTIAAQEGSVYSFTMENSSLISVLDQISLITGYKFAYSQANINPDSKGSLIIKDGSIYRIIDLLGEEFSLNSEFVGKTIILTPRKIPVFYQVNGQVKDYNTLEALQWVNITIPGNTSGTMTDSSGQFSIRVPVENKSIRFSFMGYKTRLYDIDSDTSLTILLVEEYKELDEIVVVAFGSESKDLIAGSVSVMNPGKFRQLNNESVNAALQSDITGVLVNNNAGTPGSAINITIRGISSITAGNSPLYVVDGIPVIKGNFSQLDFSGQTIDAITDLSINDIESISILKDASSSSLYGASSSNGVILINTKRGKSQKNQVQIESFYGLQSTTGRLSMLNAEQWMNLVNEEAVTNGESPVYSNDEILTNNIDTDWLNEVFRLAPTYNLYLSSSGGNEKSRYYLSGNYYDQDGIIIGSSYTRYGFRINYSYKLTDKISFECGNAFSYSKNERLEGDQSLNGPLPVAISMPPVFPVVNPDKTYNNEGPYANPVSIAMEEKNLANTYRNLFNFNAEYKVSPVLKVNSQTGIDFYNLGEQTFAPKTTRQGAKYNGLGIEANNNSFFIYHSSQINYNLRLNEHRINLIAGYSVDRQRRHGTFLRAQNFPGTSFEFLQNAATPIIASSNELDASSSSVFSSVKYNYQNKYLFTFNLRRDGSSKFGENNRYGYFPSVAGLWYISREDFWPASSSVHKLKVKASYGKTGNDQITDFISLDLFTAGTNYAGQAGISPYQLSNPDLKWESTYQLNTGLEIGIRDRFGLSLEYYLKKTEDLLLENPIPSSTGFSYFISNIGEIQNQGVELELSARLIERELRWDAGLYLSANRNKVLKLYRNQPVRNIGRAGSSIEVGKPVSFFYGFISRGVNPDDGLLIYRDINQDGKITDLDRTLIGSPFPDFHGSMLNSLAWKSFSLDFLLYLSWGNEIFNSTRLYTETISIGNQTTAILDRWKTPGERTDIPKASSYNERISSRFVEDGSFLRLKSLKLAYTLNEQISSRLGMSSLEVYMAARNLLTFTSYSGMDPEVNYNSSNSIILGTDFFTCPQPKTILLGVCAKF